MKDQFIIKFGASFGSSGTFWAAAPINPAPNWLDFIEQCRDLAKEHGHGEYWVVDEAEPRQLRFYV